MPPKSDPVRGWAEAQRIQGWYDKREARLLSKFCTGPWCEIGCHRGRSTMILAASGEDGYAIDTWRGTLDPADPTFGERAEKDFLAKLEPYENVIIIKSDFAKQRVVDLIPDNLHLLHLDADHSYEATKQAFELYSAKLVPGGYVAFHDAHGGYWPGVEQVIAELPAEEWEHVESAGLLAVYKAL